MFLMNNGTNSWSVESISTLDLVGWSLKQNSEFGKCRPQCAVHKSIATLIVPTWKENQDNVLEDFK